MISAERNNCRLNNSVRSCRRRRRKLLRHGDWTELAPRISIVGAALDPHAPLLPSFDGATADDRAVVENERLVLNRAENSVRQSFRLRPSFAFVCAEHSR